MSRTTIIYIILIILLFALLPVWPYGPALGLGWYPPGLILLVIIIFILMSL